MQVDTKKAENHARDRSVSGGVAFLWSLGGFETQEMKIPKAKGNIRAHRCWLYERGKNQPKDCAGAA